MIIGQPSRQVLRRAAIRARRLHRSLRRKGHGIMLTKLALVVGWTMAGQVALANPTGGQVVAGSATIVDAGGGTLNVLQQSDRGIINWRSFSIGAGETVNFIQRSANSVTLNRVLGNDPSAIFGRLNANGTVMLVNPNGIVFGAGSRVDVGGLVATTANIRDSDFMAGRYDFSQASTNTNAVIENQGRISIRDSGLAALVAPRVRNSGVIEARLGRVALGAANTFSLDFHGDGLLSFGAGSAITETAPGSGALVTNSGEIRADGGTVLLTARAVKGVIDNVINTEGLISATTVASQGGRIVLSGGDAGAVALGGRIDVSAADGGQGGTVIATGEKVSVAAGTTIDASGRHGGGEIALGSTGLTDAANPFSNKSESVVVAAGATLNADATDNGKGGKVTLWSTDTTIFNGEISARGGAQGGDGGFAEVSSQKNIGITGDVDLRADKGQTGTFLIDPTDLRITDTASGGTQDGNAADGSVAAGDGNQGAGVTLNTISRGLLESLSGNSNIVLQATGQITIDAMAGGAINFQTVAGRSVTMQSTQTGGIRFVDANTELRTQGGGITLEALGLGSALTNIGRLSTNGGAVTLRATGNIQIAGVIDAGTGAVQMVSTVGSITNAGATAPLVSGSSVSLTAGGGHIGAAGSAISTHTARLAVEGGGDIFAASDMALTDLSVNALHVAPGTHTYQIDASGLSFQMDDGSVLSAANIAQAGLNLTLLSDRSIELGTLDVGSGTLTVTSAAGNLTGAAGNLSTAASVVLTARGSNGNNGAIGTGSQAINTATPTLSATSGTGGAYVANTGALTLALLNSTGSSAVSSTGTLTAGNVSTGSAALSLSSTAGNVVDDGNSATRIAAGSLTVNAAGSIGTPGTRLQTNASTLSANAASGGIYAHTTAVSSYLGSIVSGDGAIDITTAGATTLGTVTSATSSLANSITIATTGTGNMTVGSVDAGPAGNVSLTTSSGSITSSGSNDVNADTIVVRAGGSGTTSNITLRSTAAHLDLENSGDIAVTQAGSVTLDNVATTGNSITVTSSDGDITIGNVRSALNGSTTLSANGGAIVDDGNSNTRLVTGSATLNAAQSIGTSANPIQASIHGLTVNNTGNVYLVNTDNTLTSLSVTNRHATPGVANVLEITSPFLTFNVTDDGSQYAIQRIVGVPLTTLSFSGDQTAVIGQVQAINGSVSITATQGDLVEDGNTDTRVTGSSVALRASQGHVGSALSPLEVNTSSLTLGTRGDLYVNSIADLSSLSISSAHADSTTAYGLVVKAPSLAFTITDSAAGHHVQNVVDASGLSFSFTSDRDITLGQVDVSYGGSVSVNSTGGSIIDDGDKTTHVLANSTALYGRAIGASGSDHLDVITGSLNASASIGGVYIDLPTATGGNYTNTLTLSGVSSGGPVQITLHEGDISINGDIYAFDEAVHLTADRGAILNPNGTVYVGNGSLTLNAAGSIGSSSRALTVYAYGAALNAQAGTGITVSSDGSLTLGTVNATPSGAVSITSTSGSLIDDGNAATGITGSQVSLSAAYGELGSSGAALSTDTTRLSLTAQGTVAVNNGATLTELTLARTGGSYGAVDITAGAGQTFDISGSNDNHTLTEVSSTSPLAFGFSGTGLVSVGTIDVGAAGSASVTSTGGSIANVDTDSAITAGTVALAAAASGSIGTSTSAIELHDTTDLSLTAGRNQFVNNDTTLARLAITSTNASTGTLSQFAVTASGQSVSLSDTGSAQVVDVVGAGDFSFTSAKNIQVSEIVGTGEILLATTGTGANANISMLNASAGRIHGSKVTLTTASTGAIGTAGTAVRVSTPALVLNGRADIHVADNQNLSLLDMTLTHAQNTTYGYGVSASNITLSITDGNTQSLGLATAGSIDFRYSVDRGLSLGTIDAGTSSTGAVSLTSRSAPTGTNAQINRSSGTITAGSVSLTAVGSNGGVGAGSTLSVSTQNLSIASGGNVSVSNSGTLLSLNLDLQHRTSGASTHSYALSSTGLTLSLSDTTGVNGLTLNSISQSGLDLSLKADRTITVSQVNVGTGDLTLSSTNSAGVANGTIYGGSGASAGSPSITADHLTLNGGNVYTYNNSNTPLYTSVNALSSNITSYLNLSNNQSLTLLDNTVGSNAKVTTTAGSILQGTDGLFTSPNLTLIAAQAIGATGAASNTVQTHARQLVLSAGRDIVVNNATDLFGLDITSNHASVGTQNTVSVTADRLDLLVTDSVGGNQYTLDHITDASGINFSLRTDVDLVVGAGDVKPGHHLTLQSAGTNTSITNIGNATLKGNSVSLLATGSVGVAGDATTRMQTDARVLNVSTGANAFVDNAQDLLGLSFTSAQGVGGAAPTYSVTAPQLTFDITSDGTTTTVNQIHDTTGLNFSLNTNQGQVIELVDVQKTGTVSLTTYRDLLAGSNPAHGINAASTTLATANYGSGTGGTIGALGQEIHLSSPLLTVNATGSVFIDSDTHIDQLTINATHPVATTSTYAIQSVPVLGNTPYTLLNGTDSNAGSVLTSLNDTEGLTFSFDSDRAIAVGDLNLGTTGSVSLSNRGGGSITGDGVAGTQIQAAGLSMNSSGGAIGAAGAGNSIEATVATLSANANGGATYLNLHGRTSVSGVSANGDVNLVNDIGDIALGSIDARGNSVNINNLGGSILSGSISRTTNVSLTAAGSIGNQSAVSLSANGGGTTTLTASAAAANGAVGSINISESYGLAADTVTAPGSVTLTAGRALSVDTVNGGGAVTLTASQGSITGTSGSNLVAGSSLTLNAGYSSGYGVGDAGTALRVSTGNLSVNTPGSIYIQGLQDLDTLSINRATSSGTTSSGTLSVSATNLVLNASDNGATTTFTNLTDSTGLDFNYQAIGRIVVGAIDVGNTGSVILRSSLYNGDGAITAVNSSSRITAGSASLTAVGTDGFIGTSGQALGLAVGTLTASSGTGGVYLTQAGSLNLSNLTTTGDLSVTATAGDLTLGTMSYGANSALRLTASVGSILAGNVTLSGTGANSSIHLTAANGIGTELAPIIVNGNAGNSVNATITGTGSLYLNSTGSLAGGLTTSVANGSTNVTAAGHIVLTSMTSGTDAVGNDINVTASAGNITVNNVSAGANARYSGVNLSANAGSILATGAGTVTGYDLNLFGANGVGTNGNRVVVNGQRVSVTTNGGAAYLGTSGASVLTNVATNGGDINVSTAHDLLIANATSGGGAITVNGTAANVDLIAGNINAGSGPVSLTSNSTGGTVQDDGSLLTRITGNTVTLQGAGGVGSALMAMQTTANTLALSDAAGGVGIYVNDNNTNGVTLSSVTAGGGAIVINAAGPLTATSVAATADAVGNNVTLSTSNGGITVGSVTAGVNNGAVVLNSAGAILGSGSGTNLSAHAAQLTANGDIGVVTDLSTGAGTPLRVNVSQLDSLTATGANRVVSINNVNTGTWTVGAAGLTMGTGGSAYLRSAGNLDVSAASLPQDGNLLLSAAGTLTLPTAGLATSGALSLTGGTDVVSSASGAAARTLSLSADTVYVRSGSAGGNTVLTTTTDTLDAGLTGAGALTVNNTGTLTQTALQTNNGDITATSSTGMTAQSVVAGGANRAVSLTATTGNLTTSTVNAGASGTISLNAAAGQLFTASSSLTGSVLNLTSGTGIGSSGSAFDATGMTVNATVTGVGDIFLSSTGGLTTGTLTTADGRIDVATSGNLTANGVITAGEGGDVSLASGNGTVTVAQALASQGDLTVAGQQIVLNGGSVNTSGLQHYTGAVTLGVDTTLTASALTMDGTVNGAQALTVNAGTGDVAFNGAVGGTARLGALVVNTAGETSVGAVRAASMSTDVPGTVVLAGDVNTTGTQTYGELVTLAANVTLTGTTVSMAHGVDASAAGGQSLTVQGDAVLGTVGDNHALSSLTVNGASTLSGTAVNTTGAQTYNGALTLDADVVLDGGALAFNGTVDGAHALTVNAGSGDVDFDHAVGGTTRLGALTVNTSGETRFTSVRAASVSTDVPGTVVLAGDVNTTGAQTYGEQVTLSSNVTLTGTTVSLAGGVDASTAGGQSLTVQGDAVLGTVGGSQALSSLTVNGASTLGGAVATTGGQTYNGAVTLGADITLSGGALAFNDTIDGAHALTVEAGSSDVVFDHAVGGTTRLGALTISTAGETRLNAPVRAASLETDTAGTVVLANTVDTTGTQTYGERVTLAANVELTGSTVSLLNGVEATTAGGQSLAIQGNAVLGNVGDTQALSSLSVSGSTTLEGSSVSTTGSQTYSGALALTDDTTLHSTGGSLVFGSTVDGPASNTLTLRADVGDIDAVGAVRIGKLVSSADAGTTRFRGALTAEDIGGLQLSGMGFVFEGAVAATTGALSIANTSALGTTSFAPGATVQAATGFTQTGGAAVYLPAVVRVTSGPISLEAPAYLPGGSAELTTNGDITLTGLIGRNTSLIMAAGPTGVLTIGRDDVVAEHKLDLGRLRVSSAVSAQMFGSIGGRTGAMAAAGIAGGLVNAPYYMNGTPWGPIDLIGSLAASTLPGNVIPSVPGVSALFTGNFSTTGLSPDALGVFKDPVVLTVASANLQNNGVLAPITDERDAGEPAVR